MTANWSLSKQILSARYRTNKKLVIVKIEPTCDFTRKRFIALKKTPPLNKKNSLSFDLKQSISDTWLKNKIHRMIKIGTGAI